MIYNPYIHSQENSLSGKPFALSTHNLVLSIEYAKVVPEKHKHKHFFRHIPFLLNPVTNY